MHTYRLPHHYIAQHIEPLRDGIARNVRVSYADERIPKLAERCAEPGAVLLDLWTTYPPTHN